MPESEELHIDILTPTIGAIVRDIDLSKSMSSASKHALEQALYKYHVLFFRNQNITPEQQRDFGTIFGEPVPHPLYPHPEGFPEISSLEFGKDYDPDKKPDSAEWHTDGTFLKTQPTLGMLYAKIIPKEGGGDTLWVNMVEVYKQELSDEMKRILDKLTAEHSFEKAFHHLIKPIEADIKKFAKARTENPPVTHPVIRQHPHTKEKYLYINESFTTKINELSRQESDLLLNYLFSIIKQRPELMCRWKWRENDVCIWDERSTQHYATADYWPQHRKLHRCAIAQNDDRT